MTILSPSEFATAQGFTDRAARKIFQRCASGGTWHGFRLPVERLPARRGGKGGETWCLRVDLCPQEILAHLNLAEIAPSTPVEQRVQNRSDDRHVAVALDRQRIIARVLATERGSAERAQAFRDVAAQPAHPIGGVWRSVAERTLREWVTAAEGHSSVALLPKSRSDRGAARVLITRAWYTGIDLREDARDEISAEIAKTARSMVANDGTSLREVRRICEDSLIRHCVAAGSILHPAKLRRICRLNAKWSERQELDRFQLIYMKSKDHKAFQDKVVARISRDLHPTPMGLLIGDVHYVDMLVEEKEEPVRVRLIHWMDASSLFVWTTPVFLSKGQGAGQEDVAESLFRVSQCRHGGIPQEYYLDNGSEYSAIAGAMIRLSSLAAMQFGVTLAKPYSPTSKGEIEGHFNILEQIFKGLPGWIAGDRTNKKAQNKGQVISPYRKGLDALEADIQAAVAIYNNRPQSGRLDGLSPLEMLEQKIADTGFVARVPSEEAFDFIFSKPETRTIRQGVIEFDNRAWHTPAIDGLPPRAKVVVLLPLRKQHDRIFVQDGVDQPSWAEPLPGFQHGDREGARLQARLEKGQKAAIKKLESQIDPKVSTFELQKEAVTRTAPDAPDPDIWTRAIDKTFLPPSAAELEAREEAEARDFMEEYLSMQRAGRREADGDNRQTSLNVT